MSSTGISILGKNGSSLEAIASTSNALKIDIASNTAGALSVSDSTAQSSLSSIDNKLPAVGQNAKSASVSVALASDMGTLAVSDSAAQSSLTTIAGDTSSLDNKFVQGYASVASGGSGLVQVLAMGKDQSGNLDPLNVDSQGHLKITINDIESGITNSIPVSDSTAQSTLSSINSALGGTLNVSDSTAQSSLSSIQTAVELIDDIVLTDNSTYSPSSSKGVKSGFFPTALISKSPNFFFLNSLTSSFTIPLTLLLCS